MKMRVCTDAILVTYGSETTILTKSEEEKLRRFERKIARKIYRVVEETDELRSPGKAARGGHRGSCKDTEAAMVRPRKKDGRRKSSEESDKAEEQEEPRWKKQVLEDIKRFRIHNRTGEDPGSEVTEENHKRDKDEQGIRIGAKENAVSPRGFNRDH